MRGYKKQGHHNGFKMPKKGTALARRRQQKAAAKKCADVSQSNDEKSNTNSRSIAPPNNFLVSKWALEVVMQWSGNHATICEDSDFKVTSPRPSFTTVECLTCGDSFPVELDESLCLGTNEAIIWGLFMSGSSYEQVRGYLFDSYRRILYKCTPLICR